MAEFRSRDLLIARDALVEADDFHDFNRFRRRRFARNGVNQVTDEDDDAVVRGRRAATVRAAAAAGRRQSVAGAGQRTGPHAADGLARVATVPVHD